MMKAWLVGMAMLATAAAAPVPAGSPVDVDAFDSILLRGGGLVVVRHGARQSVTLVSGDPATTRFTVSREGRLRIDTCVRECRNYRLELEIVTPELDGVGIEGGGEIRAEGAFPDSDTLAIGIKGGGEIDMLAVGAATVSAGIQGGGAIRAHARDRLTAGIQGGGEIRYRGDPTVTSAVNGGGAIEPLGAD